MTFQKMILMFVVWLFLSVLKKNTESYAVIKTKKSFLFEVFKNIEKPHVPTLNVIVLSMQFKVGLCDVFQVEIHFQNQLMIKKTNLLI